MKNISVMLVLSLFVAPVAAVAAEPLALRMEIHGRTPMHEEPVDGAGYGLLGASVFVGEPVFVTVTALNTPKDNIADWTQHLQWKLTSDTGEAVALSTRRDFEAPVETPHSVLLTRPDALFANFKFSALSPGRYIVGLTWTNPKTGETSSAERRRLVIYRGDETPRVHNYFLRYQARAALKDGTVASYRKARALLLEAAKDSADPNYYEELADASLPWAPPAETAEYYQRSLDIATKNLEKNLGPRREDWSPKALRQHRQRAGKVQAFQSIAQYYAANFNQVRVVLSHEDGQQVFVVERRNDGKRIRVVAPLQR